MIEHILWDVSSWIYVYFVELQQFWDFWEVFWVLGGVLVKVKIENYFGGAYIWKSIVFEVHKRKFVWLRSVFEKQKTYYYYYFFKLSLLELAPTGGGWHPCEGCQTNSAATTGPLDVMATTITMAAKHK